MNEQQFLQYLSEFKKASRNIVKSQYTWFRHEEHFQWLDVTFLIHAANQLEQHASTEQQQQYQEIISELAKTVVRSYHLSPSAFEQLVHCEENRKLIKKSVGIPTNKQTYLQAMNQLYLYKDKHLLHSRIQKINTLLPIEIWYVPRQKSHFFLLYVDVSCTSS